MINTYPIAVHIIIRYNLKYSLEDHPAHAGCKFHICCLSMDRIIQQKNKSLKYFETIGIVI